MSKMKYLFACLFVVTCSMLASAQMGMSNEHPTVSSELNQWISNVEHEFVPAAEAMPEDKYSFAPTSGEFKGVRDFATQVKHVATANYMFGAAILGEKPRADITDENGPGAIKSKTDIVKYLNDSFAYVHKAVDSISDKNAVEPIKSPFGEGKTTRLGMATLTVGHCFDHYGQMVEYLRMNGIIPPASRPR